MRYLASKSKFSLQVVKAFKEGSNDRNLAEKMRTIQSKHKGCYGIDRMNGELRRQGLHVNHKRVAANYETL